VIKKAPSTCRRKKIGTYLAFLVTISHRHFHVHLDKKHPPPGLIVGLLVGSFIVTAHFLEGAHQAVTYIVTTLSNKTNIKIIAFLYLFGGLVGMMNISGGIKGFSEWMGTKIKTERGLLGFIWLTLPFTVLTSKLR
jgi:Na+/H+ antiporter NhaC